MIQTPKEFAPRRQTLGATIRRPDTARRVMFFFAAAPHGWRSDGLPRLADVEPCRAVRARRRGAAVRRGNCRRTSQPEGLREGPPSGCHPQFPLVFRPLVWAQVDRVGPPGRVALHQPALRHAGVGVRGVLAQATRSWITTSIAGRSFRFVNRLSIKCSRIVRRPRGSMD
jgi:hypothetical protein